MTPSCQTTELTGAVKTSHVVIDVLICGPAMGHLAAGLREWVLSDRLGRFPAKRGVYCRSFWSVGFDGPTVTLSPSLPHQGHPQNVKIICSPSFDYRRLFPRCLDRIFHRASISHRPRSDQLSRAHISRDICERIKPSDRARPTVRYCMAVASSTLFVVQPTRRLS